MSEKTTITSVLREATDGILTEDALSEIETVFEESVEERASLHVEKALAEQDDDHADKLEKLLEAIDTDHTSKLNRIVNAINTDHARKLAAAASKFNATLNEDASSFKDTLVESVSNYLEIYLEKAIPAEDITTAMKNTAATSMLSQLREALAVDNALSKASIRGAVKDGKNKIDTLDTKVSQLSESNEQLSTELTKAKSSLILEQRTKDLPVSKRKYIFKVLGNKTPEFIKENYDYTLTLLEKTEEERLESFKKEATEFKQKVDRPTKTQVISESAQETTATESTGRSIQHDTSEAEDANLLSNYMEELQRT